MARNDSFQKKWAAVPSQFERPSDALIDRGWAGGAAEDPPEAKWENWWHNRVDEALAEIEANGAMAWFEDVPYAVGASVRSGGKNWLAAIASTGIEPGGVDDSGHWVAQVVDVQAAIDEAIPADPSIYQFGYLSGLTLANNSAAPTTDIDIAAGAARASGNTASLLLSAGVTKRLQVSGTWSAGSGSNGLFTGARAANTWYHVFLIRRDTDGAIDAGFDTSVTGANRPAGYSAFRRIGSVKTDASSNILPFINVAREFLWSVPVKDVQTTTGAASADFVLSAPPGVQVLAHLSMCVASNGGVLYVRTPGTMDIAVGGLTNTTFTGGVGILTDTSLERVSGFQDVITSTAAQVSVRADSTMPIAIVTHGWREL